MMLLVALVFAMSTAAVEGQRNRRADEPPLATLRVIPWVGPAPWGASGAADPGLAYRYVVEVTSSGGPVDIVADARLLRFELTPTVAEGLRVRRSDLPEPWRGPRRFSCVHPNTPRSVPQPRIETLTGNGRWRVWVDLRMYCWGRALSALNAGATVVPMLGFEHPRRSVWAARAGERSDGSVTGATFLVDRMTEPVWPPGALVRVDLASAQAAVEDGLAWRLTMRAVSEEPARIYLRDDLVRFLVNGPLGQVHCEVTRTAIAPIVDLYRVLRGRVSASLTLDAQVYCPGAFPVAGVYDVQPIVDLIYDGEQFGIHAVTGTVAGSPSPVRITAGERGYVDQSLPPDSP